MMKQLLLIVAVLVSCFFVSCNRKSKLDDKVTYIANLECRAMVMREQRFALANQLRFAQDTLSTTKYSSDSQRLSNEIQTFSQEKNSLLQHSLQLADSIHLQLDSLRKFVFTEKNDKKQFEQKLNEALRRKGCLKQ